MSGKTRVALVVVLLCLGLLLVRNKHIRRKLPTSSSAVMEEKRREWATNYAATLGPPLPMHKVGPELDRAPCCMLDCGTKN